MRRALHTTHPHFHPCKRSLHVYTQGEGFLGCLGHGDFSRRAEALPVEALASKDIRCVSAGWTHSAAICKDGELLVWGRPFDLRQPFRINRIQRVLPFLVTAINVLSSSNELFSAPVSMPLGTGPQPKPPSLFHDPRPKRRQPPPQPPQADKNTPPGASTTTAATPSSHPYTATDPQLQPIKAKDVACSAALTVVLGEDGHVYCMGYNRWGQCGQGPDNVYAVFEPLPVGGNALKGERVTSLAVGFQQVMVLTESGKVFGWGKGLRGQLGLGTEMMELPAPVDFPGKVKQLHSGFSHAVAVLENGEAYVWGRMQGTEVKKGGRSPVYHDQLYPRKIEILGGGRVVEAFCSSFNTLLRMDDGRILMFGLEVDTRRTIHTPVEVDVPFSKPGSFYGGFNDIFVKTENKKNASSTSLTSSPPPRPEFCKISLTGSGAIVSPLVLPGLSDDAHVEAVSVGWKHTIALIK